MKNIKNYISAILTICILWGCSNCTSHNQSRKNIEKAINNELLHYPNARLIDIYKNFFQDAFGPGHMIPDTQAAINYLNYELAHAEKFDTLLWQPLGSDNNYYRINLVLIKDSILPVKALLHAFISSANKAKPPSIEEWKLQWQQVISCIEEMDLSLDNYIQDKQYIDSLLSTSNYVVHHSENYSRLYHPHYRIVHKKEFKKLIKYIPSGYK